MDIFLAGLDVKSEIILQDAIGNPYSVDSVEYEVVNQSGATVVERALVEGFTPGSPSVEITVPASKNALPDSVMRELRKIVLFCQVGGNTVAITSVFVIESNSVLVAGVNSFQTFDEAQLLALEIPNMIGWNQALYADKLAALIEARQRICQLNFNLMNSSAWGQDSINYIPEGTFISPYADGVFSFGGDISFLPPEQFLNMPPRFLEALRKAQLAEANVLLGGDKEGDKRRNGLAEDTVGESKQVFRAGKVLDLQVSRPAVRYLAPFVNFSLRTAR